MISYIFTTAFYAVGIFVDATNNSQLTKRSNLQINFRFMPRALYQVSFFKLFKCNLLYLKIQEPMQNKVDKQKKIKIKKIKEIKRMRKRRE